MTGERIGCGDTFTATSYAREIEGRAGDATSGEIGNQMGRLPLDVGLTGSLKGGCNGMEGGGIPVKLKEEED